MVLQKDHGLTVQWQSVAESPGSLQKNQLKNTKEKLSKKGGGPVILLAVTGRVVANTVYSIWLLVAVKF